MRITLMYGDYEWDGVIPSDIDPAPFLAGLMKLDVEWEIDYQSEEDLQEQWKWANADLTVRIIRALSQGRFVRFMGTDYRVPNQAGVIRVSERIWQKIGRQSDCITILADDEQSLELGLFPGVGRFSLS